MNLLRTAFLALALPVGLAASAVDDFKSAMSSDDSTAKRAAIQALAGSGEKDDVVLPLLVSAVGDRQGHDAAVNALRARTGLQPAAYRGQSHYPNYPSGDSASDWSTWLSERKREKDQEAKVKEAEKVAAEAKKKADAAEKAEKEKKDKGDKSDKGDKTDAGDKGDKTAEAKTGEGEKTEDKGDKTGDKGDKGDKGTDTTAKAPVKENQPPPQDLGKLDRIVFKNGSNLVCYILTRRTDADGNLLSVRVVHPDGSGEETLAAAMISRIEEDVKQ